MLALAPDTPWKPEGGEAGEGEAGPGVGDAVELLVSMRRPTVWCEMSIHSAGADEEEGGGAKRRGGGGLGLEEVRLEDIEVYLGQGSLVSI